MRPDRSGSSSRSRFEADAPGYTKVLRESLKRNKAMIKRAMDIVVSAAVLLVLSPVMFVLSMVVWAVLGRPIIFRQTRPGLRGKLFTVYKFRTMTDGRDANGELLPDLQRAHPLGRLIERSSLDELPELYNVLKGDMSLVGPRPLLPEYLPRYTTHQARRHEVKPGITGLAQINGRRRVPFSRRLQLDVDYVDHQSTWLDLKILALTIPSVLFAKGVDDPNCVVDDIGLIPESTRLRHLRENANVKAGGSADR